MEFYLILKKQLDGFLIRRVKHCRHGRARFECLICQLQTGKFIEVWRGKGERPVLDDIKAPGGGGQTVRCS